VACSRENFTFTFPVIAAFHTFFSHYSHPAPRAALGHTETSSSTRIRKATLRVSLPPPPLPRAVLIPYSSNLFICILIFTVGLFVIYLSSFILIFSSFTVTLFHICFSSCLSCLHSRYFQQLYVVCIHPSLTLLAVITSHVLLPRRTFQNQRYRLAFFPTWTLDP
jgi:hypothetical protein